MQLLAQRGSSSAALEVVDTAVQAHSKALAAGGAAAAPTAVTAVQRAAQSALADVDHAEEGMLELAEALLDAVAVLDEEFRRVTSWLTSPKDLLGVSLS